MITRRSSAMPPGRPYTGTAADADDPLVMTAIEHLTHRYAARAGRQAAEAWRERLAVLDARTAARPTRLSHQP
ncbi:hypothetical protein AB0C21_05020 [Spirillospora sp. NPDC049024]